MKALYLRYDRQVFWEKYWQTFDVDLDGFIDLDIYPIDITLRHVVPGQHILECGCGAGRVLRHLHKHGYAVEGIEYDAAIVEKLRSADPALKITRATILALPYGDSSFDTTLCFGVIGGLQRDTAKALGELIRVTRRDGLLLVSVMLNNAARCAQKLVNFCSKDALDFYAWMDTCEGWKQYFHSFGLDVVEAREIVSRYNLYYWAPLLRSRMPSNLRLARVKESEYRLNLLGNCLWWFHKHWFRKAIAGGMTFVLRNRKAD